MKKTLAHYFGMAALVCGGSLVTLPAYAQSGGPVSFELSTLTSSGGPARANMPQVVHVINVGGVEATGVVATFTLPKGVRADGCLVTHEAGGIRSYSCLAGNIASGQGVDITFSLSANKPAVADFFVEVTCDQSVSSEIELNVPLN